MKKMVLFSLFMINAAQLLGSAQEQNTQSQQEMPQLMYLTPTPRPNLTKLRDLDLPVAHSGLATQFGRYDAAVRSQGEAQQQAADQEDMPEIEYLKPEQRNSLTRWKDIYAEPTMSGRYPVIGEQDKSPAKQTQPSAEAAE